MTDFLSVSRVEMLRAMEAYRYLYEIYNRNPFARRPRMEQGITHLQAVNESLNAIHALSLDDGLYNLAFQNECRRLAQEMDEKLKAVAVKVFGAPS